MKHTQPTLGELCIVLYAIFFCGSMTTGAYWLLFSLFGGALLGGLTEIYVPHK